MVPLRQGLKTWGTKRVVYVVTEEHWESPIWYIGQTANAYRRFYAGDGAHINASEWWGYQSIYVLVSPITDLDYRTHTTERQLIGLFWPTYNIRRGVRLTHRSWDHERLAIADRFGWEWCDQKWLDHMHESKWR